MPDLFAVAFTLSLRITESPLIKLCFTNDNGFNSLTINSAPSPTEGLLSSMPDTFVISISTESLSLSLSLLSKEPVVELRSVINLLDSSDWVKMTRVFLSSNGNYLRSALCPTNYDRPREQTSLSTTCVDNSANFTLPSGTLQPIIRNRNDNQNPSLNILKRWLNVRFTVKARETSVRLALT
uniref:Uncharacterized protein n=1 Tax=Glossina austeni TaxID=7395 RepID=A0A1A9UTA8_GLOAU